MDAAMSKTFHRFVALAGASILLAAACSPVLAGDVPAVRGDVMVQRDALTLGDLVDGVPAALAGTALFRAPALGQSGTIQVRRIVEAAAGLGMSGLETGGRLQVMVTRAARHVGPGEVEAVLKRLLEREAGLDPRFTGIRFEGTSPALTLPPDETGPLVGGDLVYDRRTRRVLGTVWIGSSATERRASMRVAGVALDLVEVGVLSRSIERGEAIRATDVTVERRPREAVAPDAVLDLGPVEGRVARRALAAGGLVRNGDLIRPTLVDKGEVVTVVYEAPGMALSLRATAAEAGALGDVIGVVNPSSKKAIQAKVIGPGRVAVSPGQTQRVVASAAAPRLP
jgi:flagella basal body P-ring formation protein FlgA